MKKQSFFPRAAAVVIVGVMTFLAFGANRLALAQDGCSYHGPDCTGCSVSAKSSVSAGDLTQDEQRVIEYICDQVVESGNVRFDSKHIEKATGVSLENIKESTIHAGVIAELERRNFNIDRLVRASNCSRFNACSVNRDLSGASGEELERYGLEKSQDGKTFTEWYAPDFTLPSTAGEQVSLSDYR
ncbi:MAG: hypothetical protein O7D34_07190, partial [Ignavibacteria bacterium]|nr:hypothetical protein [Ignavibacteria bacterium]